MIRKILFIAISSLFFFSLVKADCIDDLTFSNTWYDVKYPYQEFTFKNKSKNTIEIIKTGIYAKGTTDVVIQWDNPTIVFGYRQITFSFHYLGDLNQDVLGKRFYSCKYNYDYD